MKTAFLWRATMADAEVAPADRERFEAWLRADAAHARAYERARRFWDEMGDLDPAALDPAFFKPSPGERLRRAPAPRGGLGARRLAPLAGGLAAACLVLLLAVQLIPGVGPAGPETYTAAVGRTRGVDLADGSRITLGADTSVEVRFTPELRLVRMGPGEAYFEVARDADRPFEVVVGGTRIVVHGTAFNVRRSARETQVAVREGVVSVHVDEAPQAAAPVGAPAAQAAPAATLAAGERLTVRADGDATRDASLQPEAVGAWRENLLVYIDAPLAEIAADINRYRHRKVRIAEQDVAELRVTATFDSGDIDGLLQTLTEVFPVRLDATAQEIVLRRVR
jgi:transmembrane sensor